jgi:hypothetical protein
MERTGGHVVPLTQEQLAGLLGVGRSYISRVIQTFKAEGILENRARLDFDSQRCRAAGAIMPLQRKRQDAFRRGAPRRVSQRFRVTNIRAKNGGGTPKPTPFFRDESDAGRFETIASE